MTYTLTAYQNDAERTNANDSLANKALGLCGEAGEVAELIKKHLYHSHPLDREKLRNELGDVLWYIATLANDLGMPLSEIAEANVAKLRKRYPDGFSVERSVNREEARAPVFCEVEECPGSDMTVVAPDDFPAGALVTFDGAPIGVTPRAVVKGESFVLTTNNAEEDGMNSAELKAAGWDFGANGYTRGEHQICYLSACGAGVYCRLQGGGFGLNGPKIKSFNLTEALKHFGAVLMPDGRTVREWALSPP